MGRTAELLIDRARRLAREARDKPQAIECAESPAPPVSRDSARVRPHPAAVERALARMGLPHALQAETTWRRVGDEALPLRARPEFDALRRWVHDPERPSLLVVGEVGVGKTRASVCVARALLQRGTRTLWRSAPELFANLFDDALWLPALSVPVLILDDLGREVDPNERAIERFFLLIDARWRRRLPLLITTNLAHQARPWLTRRYGAQTCDRLLDPSWTRVLAWTVKQSKRT